MTKVTFCHGAADRLQAAALWVLRSSQAQGATATMLVYVTDREAEDRLDRLLWTHPATGFLPHCRADSPLAAQTPLLLARNLDGLAHSDTLLNLSDELPPGFSRFESLIEIISDSDTVRLPARERVKFYRDRGYDIQFRDLNKEPL